jgi:hypothetical protein
MHAGTMMKFHSQRWILATAAVCALAAFPSMAPAEEPLASIPLHAPIIDPIGPIGPAPIVPPVGSVDGPFLSGHFTDLTVKTTKAGNFVKVKGLLTIENIGRKVARNVRVAVYLSPDQARTPGAGPIAKLELSEYHNGNGKIKELGIVTIPIEYKLPTLIASNLSGKYLIFVLAANNFRAKAGAPIVEGPLPTVP